MSKSLKAIFFRIIVTCLLCIGIYTTRVYADEPVKEEVEENDNENVVVKTYEKDKLQVNITNANGETILIKAMSEFIIGSAIKFSLNTDNDCYYSVSIDGGKNFGGYVKMEDSVFTLVPNESLFKDNKFIIRFRAVDEEKCIEYLSDDFFLTFDLAAPLVNLNNPEVFNGWQTDEAVLNASIIDNVAIARIVVEGMGKTILEEHFEQNLSVTTKEIKVSLSNEARDLTGQDVRIYAYDFAGNENIVDINYFLDRTKPTLMLGGIESGEILQSDGFINAQIEDNCLGATYLQYSLIRNYNGVETTENVTTNALESGGNISIPIYEEGIYTVVAHAFDMAGNRTEDISIDFIKDGTAPSISIEGASENVDSKEAVNLTINIQEALYDGCEVTVSAVRKKGEEVKNLPVSNFTMGAPNEVRVLSLENDGDYEIYVSATDRAGNHTEETRSFRIDATAPMIRIMGLKEGEITNEQPVIRVGVKEAFYNSTILNTDLYKKNKFGELERVNGEKIVPKGVLDYKDIKISDEGVYQLVCTASDRTGNIVEEKIDFTVDYTPPTIAKLDGIDGKYLNFFELPKNIKELVTDMTDVSLEAYLNDKKMDANEVVLDEGKYVLWLSATDAANNTSDSSETFIIDHTKPQVVLSGVKVDGSIKKGSLLEISLFDNMDILDEVIFNGKRINVDTENNRACINVDDYGDYNIEVKAHDLAGNVTDNIIYSSCYMAGGVIDEYVKSEKTIAQNLVKTADFDKEIVSVLIGVITVLSGTYGLVFRGLSSH